jgi:hypothetical protein
MRIFSFIFSNSFYKYIFLIININLLLTIKYPLHYFEMIWAQSVSTFLCCSVLRRSGDKSCSAVLQSVHYSFWLSCAPKIEAGFEASKFFFCP